MFGFHKYNKVLQGHLFFICLFIIFLFMTGVLINDLAYKSIITKCIGILIKSDLCQQLKLVLNLNLTRRTLDWGRNWLVNFNSRKTELVSFDCFNNLSAIDVKADWWFLNKKSLFNVLGLSFTSKLDWGFYIVSIFKTALKRFGAFIFSMKFLFTESALYPNKFTIWSRMECMCHV